MTGKKVGGYSVATSMLVLGVIGLIIGGFVALWVIGASSGCVPYLGPGAEGCEPPPGITDYCVPVVILAVSIVLMWVSFASFKYASTIAPVQPVTPQNAHILPLNETLVRASHCSSASQSSELLRVPQEAGSPAIDLLTPIADPSNLKSDGDPVPPA